tara:strand:- start:1531 stop:1854 length:324 start_codon:yes stop_codon:yes gene_type:complete
MKYLLLAYLLATSITANASLGNDLSGLVGYTIIASKTITGWYDNDNDKKSDSFEGCSFSRVIVFDNSQTLTCNEYNYEYSYRPTAIILSNGSSFKMIVGDHVYNMRR